MIRTSIFLGMNAKITSTAIVIGFVINPKIIIAYSSSVFTVAP
jgi:hypothetical protein